MISTSAVLRHAAAMIFRDINATIKVLSPALLIIGATAVAALLLAPTMVAEWFLPTDETPALPSANQVGLTLIAALAVMLGFVLMAILWHRYVLASEETRRSGVMPEAGVIAGYIWRTILLALILMLFTIPMIIIVGLIVAATGGAMPVAIILGLVVAAFMAWASLRLSLVLPAIALERPIGFGDSWRATAPASGQIFWLAIILAALNQLVTTVLGVLVPGPLFLAVALQLIGTVILTLISVSVLTTLYGVLIEQRDID